MEYLSQGGRSRIYLSTGRYSNRLSGNISSNYKEIVKENQRKVQSKVFSISDLISTYNSVAAGCSECQDCITGRHM